MKIKLILILIFVICVLGLTLAIVRSCNHIINPARSSVIASETRQSQTVLPVQTSTKLFSTHGSHLQITIPPQKDTLKIKINDELKPSLISNPESLTSKSESSNLQSSNLRIVKVVPLIRYHPTFHVSLLSRFDSLSLNPGLKCRFIEIHRFGLTAHLNYSGIGPGLDVRLISNLSLDCAYLLSFEPLNLVTFKLLNFNPYFGLSLKL